MATESWDTCSGLLTALPAHGQDIAEPVLFLGALQVKQTRRIVMFWLKEPDPAEEDAV